SPSLITGRLRSVATGVPNVDRGVDISVVDIWFHPASRTGVPSPQPLPATATTEFATKRVAKLSESSVSAELPGAREASNGQGPRQRGRLHCCGERGLDRPDRVPAGGGRHH